MIIKTAEFITSAVKLSQYPTASTPEIAFAGRSNVGKSSLINTLVNRKRLVKTSNTPGRTQLINFFNINNELTLVDLPGYGYAKVPPAIKKQWKPMIETYLSKREALKGVVLLMDIRRTPQIEEMDFLRWLQLYHLTPVLVVTKADKLSKNKQKKQLQVISRTMGVEQDQLILFSAKTRLGKEKVWTAIEEAVNKENE